VELEVPNDPDRPRFRCVHCRLACGRSIVLAVAIAVGAGVWAVRSHTNGKVSDADAVSSQSKRPRGLFYPSPAEWATLTVEPVQQRVFRSEHVTEGKIAVDEDRSTPIYSPYAGRCQGRRHRDGRPAAVHGRSHRHGARSERLHRRRDRAEQGPLGAQPGADQRPAAALAL
jgi:hypothetical protein